MANVEQVVVPDIGGASDVDVIEVHIAPGDIIEKEAPLITLESDKATMEIPSPVAGEVSALQVKVGDKVSEGHTIAQLVLGENAPVNNTANNEAPAETNKPQAVASATETPLLVPDIGGSTDVDVIEVHIAPGDTVELEEALITLESEKATMEVPASAAGAIQSVAISVGDKVSEGDLIANIISASEKPTPVSEPKSTTEPAKKSEPTTPKPQPVQNQPQTAVMPPKPNGKAHAGPAVRQLARVLGVELTQVRGSGPKGRVLKTDLEAFVKDKMSGQPQSQAGFGLPAMPEIDFAKFGDIEIQPLNKIKKITGANMARNWLTVPHVTHFDNADITDLEAFRQEYKQEALDKGVRLTMLAFMMKAVVGALQTHPQFNTSLDSSQQNLIMKKYFHIGVAVDTPNGLVVPVLRDIDKKGVYEIADELSHISTKAREKGLMPNDMQGGCFTISSLGGIGGTAFTPIVNAPDVAILGVSKASMQPVYQDGRFVPRLICPLSLSYDHRVIDGAQAAHFMVTLTKLLKDIRGLLL